MVVDILSILYVLSMIVALMFAVGFCLGVVYIVFEKAWQIFVDTIAPLIR